MSVTALIATPYAFMYDMAALMIPVAFIARDQIARGSLAGEAEIEIGLFAAALALLIIFGDAPRSTTFGATPIGIFTAVVLLGVILRRIFRGA